jgi:hypothetical protein
MGANLGISHLPKQGPRACRRPPEQEATGRGFCTFSPPPKSWRAEPPLSGDASIGQGPGELQHQALALSLALLVSLTLSLGLMG